MIRITDEAKRRMVGMMRGNDQKTMRLIVSETESKSPLAVERSLAFIKGVESLPDDEVIDMSEFELYIDPDSVAHLQEGTIDYNQARGFVVKSNAAKAPNLEGDELAQKFQQLLDEQINPAIAAHGGYITLYEVKDGNAYVEFGGGCQGCGMANVTLKQGVEAIVQDTIPEIKGIYDVTDHASGTNPYYQPSTK